MKVVCFIFSNPSTLQQKNKKLQIDMYIENEHLATLAKEIMGRFDKIDKTLERMTKLKDCLDGDTLLDNYDMCALLGVTKRTLARYRQLKKVTYYMIDGRTYYKSSEIKEFLKKKGLL